MQRPIHIAVVAALAGCSIDPIDLTMKDCPCIGTDTCVLDSKRCVAITSAPTASVGCVIYTDGQLYCSNTAPSVMYDSPNQPRTMINTLRSLYSWFICWGPGEPYALSDGTQSTTWYFTVGDDANGHQRGWLPGAVVAAPKPFHTDPAAFGFHACP